MRVGTSLCMVYQPSFAEDHPHACGDKSAFQSIFFLLWGSSPCVWGQVNRFLQKGEKFGIIPMRVGTRAREQSVHWLSWDHPHACGDKLLSDFVTMLPPGSSPCVWGQVPLFALRCTTLRIIPMRVGTSRVYDRISRNTRDHPHACGDKYFFDNFVKLP